MTERHSNQRTYTVSQASRRKPITSKGYTRSRVLSDKSGYAAAEFNFSFPNFPQALIITEPNEDTSSWQ